MSCLRTFQDNRSSQQLPLPAWKIASVDFAQNKTLFYWAPFFVYLTDSGIEYNCSFSDKLSTSHSVIR